MAMQALAALLLGVGIFFPASQGARLRAKRHSTRQNICEFGIFRDGYTQNDEATDNNVIFRSNDVLVVQEGSQRTMLFMKQGGLDGNSKDPYCHEQAEIACGDMSTRPKSKAMLQSGEDDDASAACGSRQACHPATIPDLSYVRSMLGGAVVARKGEMNRVASIGLGAGTIPLFWSRVQPNTKVEAIDLSPDVISAAPCFGVKQSSNLQLIQEDGRKYIESQKDGSYDIIFLDAFDDADNIPNCLKTVDFFKMVNKKLAPGGVLSMNVWRREIDKVYPGFVQAFPGRTQIGTSPGLGNIVLLGRADGGASVTRVSDDDSDPTSPEAVGLASARAWAIEAEFGSASAEGEDGSRTLSLLAAEGHNLLEEDPKTSSSSVLQDTDICSSYATGRKAVALVDDDWAWN